MQGGSKTYISVSRRLAMGSNMCQRFNDCATKVLLQAVDLCLVDLCLDIDEPLALRISPSPPDTAVINKAAEQRCHTHTLCKLHCLDHLMIR